MYDFILIVFAVASIFLSIVTIVLLVRNFIHHIELQVYIPTKHEHQRAMAAISAAEGESNE